VRVSDYDLKYNREAVCPYCRTIQTDTWEAMGRDVEEVSEMTCDSCEKEFYVYGHIDITYSTKPKQEAHNDDRA
jgi:hypothetical protein